MKEAVSMWKHTKMVVLVALSAAIYAAVLIPFKGFVLIPGFTEFRPASALPVVLGLLFGPAGAWGAAIGNLIGDFFGTLSIGSFFGFIGNFYAAYVPYKLWNRLGLVGTDDNDPLLLNNAKKTVNFVCIAMLSALSCALMISWGLELLHLVPFAAIASIIFFNNSIPSLLLGIPLMMVLYPRIKKWDLLWTDIVTEEEMQNHNALSRLGVTIMLVGIVGGMVAGLIGAMTWGGQAVLTSGFGKGQIGNASVIALAGTGVACTAIGGLLRKK